MKQSSKLLVAVLLTINFVSFSMKKEAPQASETSIEAFKSEARKLNFREFAILSRVLAEFLGMYTEINEEERFTLDFSKQLAAKAKLCALVTQTSERSYSLLKEFKLPVPKFDEVALEFNHEEISCLHPAIMTQFSPKFQEAIKSRKNEAIQRKLQNRENPENWSTSQKQAFGVELFNSELNALNEDVMNSTKNTWAHFQAIGDLMREKGLGDISILSMCEMVKDLEKNSMDFSNIEIVKIKNMTVIRRRSPQSDPKISQAIDEALEKFKKEENPQNK